MKNIFQLIFPTLLLVCLYAVVAQAQGPTLDPSFAVVSAVGNRVPVFPQIVDMVRQPDGKLLIAGDFGLINGRPAFDVCRMLANGQVDSTFAYARTDAPVKSIALQADGRVLVGGDFRTIAGRPYPGVARLFANGQLDLSFTSPFGGTPTLPSRINKVVIQPGAGVLILGILTPTSTTGMGTVYMARLLETTGARDTTFRPGFNDFGTLDALVLPSGRLVVAGRPRLIGGQQCNVWGALPNGALDPAFVPLPSTVAAEGFALDPSRGHIYLAAAVPGTGLDSEPVRLLPNGIRDPAFSTAGTFVAGAVVGSVQSIAVQPNGRLLLGGTFPVAGGGYLGSARLLPNGARDPSYLVSNGPNDGCRRVLVQPDGALVFAGYFSQAGGFALNCLARMLDPNVLAISKQQAEASLAAWPVPARDVLHLRLAPGSSPLRVALLDVLGREVLTQSAAAGQTALTLPTAGLPPGAYLLRVAYPSGPVLRRVAVE